MLEAYCQVLRNRPLEAPLVDRGACIIGEVLRAGINYFREVIPARRAPTPPRRVASIRKTW
jgi:hypothetical protein